VKGEIHLSRLAIALGIPAFRRDGHRVELENLRAEVAAFQPSKAALELDQKLAAGLAELYKPGDDTFRKGTVEAAEKIIVEVQAKLKELQQARLKQQGQQKGAAPNAEALKAMQATRQRLTKALDGKLATISGDAGKVQLPEQMQPAALRGNGELIRVAIAAGDPNQPAGNGTRAAAIEQDIEALGKQIALLNQRVAEDYAYVGTEAPKALKSFETLLDEFDAKAGGKGKYAGPLAGVVDGLKRQLAGSPISADAVRRQLAACETIAKTARATPDYVGSTQAEAVERKNAAEITKQIVPLCERFTPHFEYLKEASEPVYAALSDELAQLRSAAGKPVADDAVAGQLKQLQDKLDALLIKTADAKLKVSQQIVDEARRLQQDLVAAKARRDRLHDQELKGIVALTADWKAIDAQLGSATDMVPLTGLPPIPLSAKDIKIVEGLIAEVANRLDSVEQDKDKLLALEAQRKRLDGFLAERSFFERLTQVGREKLEKYDPAKRAAFAKRLETLDKSMAATPAANILAAFEKLQTDIEAALGDVLPAAAYVETQFPALLAKLKQDMEKRFGEHVFTTNNPAQEALEALDALVAKQPPDKAAIEAALAAAREVLKLDSKALADQTKAAAAEKQRKTEEDDKKRAEYTDRMLPLKGLFAACQQAVKAVSGDQNALGTTQRLINDIEAAIKGNSFDGLDKRLLGLKDRLELLLRNPMGEANRKVSELPKVLEALRLSCTEAAAGLQSTAELIKAEAPKSQVPAEAAKTVATLLSEFAFLFQADLPKIEQAVQPLSDPQRFGEDARRAAREKALALTSALDARLRGQPLTRALLTAPFPAAKAAVAPVYRSIEQFSYTVSTCV
jgi:hypothetical protein